MGHQGKSATALLHEFASYGTPYCDPELNDALDDLYAHGFGNHPVSPPRVSDYDFYNMVRVIQPFNFPALAMEGLRTGHDTMNFLFDMGLHSLIYRNDKQVEAAKELDISPADYTDICSVAHSAHATEDEIIRALRLHAKLGTAGHGVPEVIYKILLGHIRYEDAEHIGFDRLVRHTPYRQPLFEALVSHKWRHNTTYDRNDIVAVFSARPDATARNLTKEPLAEKINKSRAARLELLPIAGADAALSVRYPLVIMEMIRRKEDTAHFKEAGTVAYIDSLLAAVNGERGKLPPMKDIKLFAEHGVEPELVVRERETGSDTLRIMALHEGAHSAMTGGWL